MDCKTVVGTITREYKLALLVGLSLLIVVMNIPRIHFNLFWGDECFSILCTTSFDVMVNNVINDAGSNPPLYCSMLYFFTLIFGRSVETYQLFSLLALVAILLANILFIHKEFGFTVSFFFMIMSSFLAISIAYITEVRSYEWDAFFILMCFIFLYKILEKHQTKHYVWFVIFSLLGAYSHYYCLLAVAFFYLVLIYDAFKINREYRKITVLSIVFSIIGYMPWMIVALRSMIHVSSVFWLTSIPTFKQSFSQIFLSDYGMVLFFVMLITTVFVIIRMKNNGESDRRFFRLWLLSGLISIIGSILLAYIVSEINRPLLVLRYLYPVSIVGWLLLSYSFVNCWTNIDWRKAAVITVAILISFAAFSCYESTFRKEKALNESTEESLKVLECIQPGDYVMTDVVHFDWTMVDYYFPGVDHCDYWISPYDIPDLDPSVQYYFMINEKMDDDIISELSEQGYTYETIMEPASINNYIFNVYKIVPE